MAALVPLFVAGAAAAALAAALISQYGFDLQPCVLCIWQRWPYLAAILLGLAAVVSLFGLISRHLQGLARVVRPSTPPPAPRSPPSPSSPS